MKKKFLKIRMAILKARPFKRCRNIYFLVENMALASSVLRGQQIATELLQQGVFAQVIDLSDTDPQRVRRISNGIVVFIKSAFKLQARLLEQLQRQQNILIWDPVDGLAVLCHELEVKLFDGVIFSSRRAAQHYRGSFHERCREHVIYHHWDPRCRSHQAKAFSLVYLGDTTPENLCQEHVENLRELVIEPVKLARDVKEKNLFERMMAYSCHFSVRKEEFESFIYKPAPKLALASAMGANIILSRDYSNTEILDSRYPFYTSAEMNDVLRVVDLARESYGGRTWNEALGMMRDVRERTSLRSVAREYVTQFRNYR